MYDSASRYESARELDLISAAKCGDHAAFVELCRRYTKLLKRRIQGIVRNREDAEDILQETLLRAYKHLSGFRAECGFHTWIMTIATNNSLMLLRRRRSHHETGVGFATTEGDQVEILALADPSPNPEQLYAKRQASDRVAEAVRRLPLGFRQIVERYHQDEVRLADAANAIGITEGAAKSRLLRARKVLRRRLSTRRARHSG
jgi:RNA polymerase sigma-70 factor (ECF subfamily)